MITRREAEAYEKWAQAKQRSAGTKARLYEALLDKFGKKDAPARRHSKNEPETSDTVKPKKK